MENQDSKDVTPVFGDEMQIIAHRIYLRWQEVSAISMLQFLHPEHKAKLVSLPSIEWQTTFTDATREEYHRNKMISKDSRPQLQLEVASIPFGFVSHIGSPNSS